MRVLLVNKFHWRKGGSETYYFGLRECLRARGHEVACFSMDDPRNEPCDQSEYFVSSIDYNSGKKVIKKAKEAAAITFSREAKSNFEKLLQDFKPDVIHLNLVHRQITFSILSAPSAIGIPVIYTSHDFILVCPGYLMLDGSGVVCEDCLQGRFFRCFKRKCVKRSRLKSLLAAYEAYYLRMHRVYSKIDRIITPSEYMRGKLLEAGFPSEQVVFLQNFVGKELLTKARIMPSWCRERIFFYSGRLSYEKGVDTVIKAFISIFDDLPEGWRLIIAGDGPEYDAIKAIIPPSASCGIQLLGRVAHDRVLEYTERAFFAVVDSRCRENMPFSVVEALACSTPVIGARIGGIPELVIERETGFLCEPDSVESLSQVMLRAANIAPDDYLMMQRNCREYILNHCSPDRYIEELESLYDTVLLEKGNVLHVK